MLGVKKTITVSHRSYVQNIFKQTWQQ